MRVLELYAGVGGLAEAVRGRAEVALAVDQSALACRVYRLNHGHPFTTLNLAGIRAERLAALDVDLWWMSPPCQPFTTKGVRRDLDDPRAKSLLVLIGLLARLRPPRVALENVPGFLGSRAHRELHRALEGYAIAEGLLCPSELGRPMLRRRYYLLASRVGPVGWAPPAGAPRGFASLLEDDRPEWEVDPAWLTEYEGALNLVDRDDPSPRLSCFTAAYGRSPVRSGSYLRTARGARFFTPREICRLLGFSADFRFPLGLPRQRAFALAGNSLSVDAVRWVLADLLPAPQARGP